MSGSSTYEGWDTHSSDYHAHISKMTRALSIAPGVSQYPVVFKAFNNKPPVEEAQVTGVGKQRQPRKVSFQDQQVHEETENPEAQAEAYIQQKHKGFELCKWKTFKAY